jgi:hypothetical protein
MPEFRVIFQWLERRLERVAIFVTLPATILLLLVETPAIQGLAVFAIALPIAIYGGAALIAGIFLLVRRLTQ